MNHITATDLIEHLNWRYATKQFDPAKSIAPEIWTALEDALVLTPSSYGVQPWKFLIVTSLELKAQLKPYSWNQSQVTNCSHYVVFAIRKNLTAEDIDRFIARTAKCVRVPLMLIRTIGMSSLVTWLMGLAVLTSMTGQRAKLTSHWVTL
jgi:nitroreductase